MDLSKGAVTTHRPEGTESRQGRGGPGRVDRERKRKQVSSHKISSCWSKTHYLMVLMDFLFK